MTKLGEKWERAKASVPGPSDEERAARYKRREERGPHPLRQAGWTKEGVKPPDADGLPELQNPMHPDLDDNIAKSIPPNERAERERAGMRREAFYGEHNAFATLTPVQKQLLDEFRQLSPDDQMAHRKHFGKLMSLEPDLVFELARRDRISRGLRYAEAVATVGRRGKSDPAAKALRADRPVEPGRKFDHLDSSPRRPKGART